MKDFKQVFNANFDTDVGYLVGKARNEDIEGDGTGTPWHQIVINDLMMGPVSALFNHSDVVADNSDEKAGQSQWVDALKTLAKDMNWGDRYKGSFAKGFTYTSAEDVGRGQDGEYYKYIGSDPLPKSVPAGLNPVSFPSDYALVENNSASTTKTNTTESTQDFIDSFALKIFQSPNDSGLTEIQTRTIDANEVYEVRKTSDDSLATIYSDADGATEIVQNGTDNKSGSDGVVEFFVADGDYYVEVDGVKSNFTDIVKATNVETSDGKSVQDTHDAMYAMLIAQGLSGSYGFFDKGFDYVNVGDVGINTDGKMYTYVGAGAPVKTVVAGTNPASNSDFSQFLVDTGKVLHAASVSEMLASRYLLGSVVETKQYHEGTGYGGGKYVIKNATQVAADGDIIDGFANHQTEYDQFAVLTRGDLVSDVLQFGAWGDKGLHDDYPPIQAAIDKWISDTQKILNTEVGNTYFGTLPEIKFGGRVFSLSQGLNLSIGDVGYSNIDFGGAAFIEGAGFDKQTFGINLYGFVNKISNFKMLGFDKDIRISNLNVNGGKIVIDNIEVHLAKVALEVECRSSQVVVTNFKFTKVSKILRLVAGDMVIFREGWVSGCYIESEYEGLFSLEPDSFSSGLTLVDVFYVPHPQDFDHIGVVCVKDGCQGRVNIVRGIYGGEQGRIPLVVNLNNAKPPFGRGNSISIDGALGFTSGTTAVALYGLPNNLVFTNYMGGVEQGHRETICEFREDIRTLTEAEAMKGSSRFEIHFIGATPWNFTALPAAQLGRLTKYVVSPSKYENFFAEGVTNTNGHVIKTKALGGKSMTFRVSVINVTNNGPGRYSEYILTSTQTQAPNASWYVEPIIEGDSTVAGRVSVDEAGDVVVKANSGAASDFAVVVETISRNEAY